MWMERNCRPQSEVVRDKRVAAAGLKLASIKSRSTTSTGSSMQLMSSIPIEFDAGYVPDIFHHQGFDWDVTEN
jgi:hypothetical protein